MRTHSYVQSFLHAMPYSFLSACGMTCSMLEFEACRSRGSLQWSRRNARTSDYVRRRAHTIKQCTAASLCMIVAMYVCYRILLILLVILDCVFGRGFVWAMCTLCARSRKGVYKPNPGVHGGVWGLVLFGGGQNFNLGRLRGALQPTPGHQRSLYY